MFLIAWLEVSECFWLCGFGFQAFVLSRLGLGGFGVPLLHDRDLGTSLKFWFGFCVHMICSVCICMYMVLSPYFISSKKALCTGLRLCSD